MGRQDPRRWWFGARVRCEGKETLNEMSNRLLTQHRLYDPPSNARAEHENAFHGGQGRARACSATSAYLECVYLSLTLPSRQRLVSPCHADPHGFFTAAVNGPAFAFDIVSRLSLSSAPPHLLRSKSSLVGHSRGSSGRRQQDGVLKQGSHVLPQALKVMRVLNGENKLNRKYPFICVTNGGGSLELARSKRLTRELQVPVSAVVVLSSFLAPVLGQSRARNEAHGVCSMESTRTCG